MTLRLQEQSTISNDGCPKCNYTGTITEIRRVTRPGYVDKNGELIPFDTTAVELCECRRDRMFMKYNVADQLTESEQQHTFQNAIIDPDNQKQYEIASHFVRDIFKHMENGTWMYIFGDEKLAAAATKEAAAENNDKEYEAYGTGKTYLMQCIANALSRRRIPVLYVTEEKLFGDIKATFERNSDESEASVLDRYYRVPVLMIDDVFTASYTEWSEGKLFSILDERMRDKKVTIMTGNYALGRVKERLPINGAKLASRIKGQCKFGEESNLIEMIGPDRR